MTEQWKPSNGSDLERMMCLCDRCERDRAAWPVDRGGEDRPEDGCEIVALMGMNGEHPSWVIGDDGRPTCTQFIREGKEIPFVDTQTLPLFGDKPAEKCKCGGLCDSKEPCPTRHW